MSRLYRIAIAALMVCLAGTSGHAGIAFVQAPEQSFGYCTGDSPDEAFACARKMCVEGGAAEQDCLQTTWCDNGWAVDVFMQSKEGPHWHEYHCGWNSRAEAEQAAAVACNKERLKDLMECAPVQYYDPEGKPQLEN